MFALMPLSVIPVTLRLISFDFEAISTQVPDAENYVSTVSIAESVYQSPRSGCVYQTALPERPDAVDPSNPVNPVR